jgi:hypothetical protein
MIPLQNQGKVLPPHHPGGHVENHPKPDIAQHHGQAQPSSPVPETKSPETAVGTGKKPEKKLERMSQAHALGSTTNHAHEPKKTSTDASLAQKIY